MATGGGDPDGDKNQEFPRLHEQEGAREFNTPFTPLELTSEQREELGTSEELLLYIVNRQTVDNQLPEDAERVVENELVVPLACTEQPSDRSHAAHVGDQLKLVADEFSRSKERIKVTNLADSVPLESLTRENFNITLDNLFRDGVNVGSFLALFFYVADLGCRVYQTNRDVTEFLDFFKKIVRWFFKWLVNSVLSGGMRSVFGAVWGVAQVAQMGPVRRFLTSYPVESAVVSAATIAIIIYRYFKA